MISNVTKQNFSSGATWVVPLLGVGGLKLKISGFFTIFVVVLVSNDLKCYKTNFFEWVTPGGPPRGVMGLKNDLLMFFEMFLPF